MPGVRNRVAVVTGAANGLGREIAMVLAREGARVALGDMDGAGVEQTAAAISAAGGVAVTVAGDLTEEAPAAKLIEAAVERLGGLDILVNNVGGSRNRKIWEMPVEDWDVERRFRRSTKSQSSTGISQIFRLRLPPTLLTRMSRPPSRSTAASISFAAGASSVRSPATVTATPPAAVMAAAVCSTPAASMSPRATRAPSRARTSAISRPRPLAAPVTTATRFLTPGMRVMLAREPAPLPGGRHARHELDCGGARAKIDRATREELHMTAAADGTKAAFAAEYDVPI